MGVKLEFLAACFVRLLLVAESSEFGQGGRAGEGGRMQGWEGSACSALLE